MMRGTAVSGGQQRRATWNTFAGIPWQVGDKRCYLPRFCGNTVAGGQQGDATWHAFAGIPWQVRGGEMLPGTLLRGFRARWAAGRCHLEHFCGDSVPGGRRGDATWNTFAGIPCQVGGRKSYLEHFCGDSVPGGRRGDATWNTLVEGREGHLTRFCGDSGPGGRRKRTPGTLLQGFRAR